MSADDYLNTMADATTVAAIVFHSASPAGDETANVAAGTDASYPVTAGTAGDPGPYDEPATAGRVYFSAVEVTTTERITHISLLDSLGGFIKERQLREPFGPGTFPFVYATQLRLVA